MRVCEILRKKNPEIHSILANESIQAAVNRMVEKRIGCLIVTDPKCNVVGIITERDVLRESAKPSHDLNHRKVSDIMTRQLITAEPDETVHELLKRMTRNRIRRLPVMTGSQIHGLVTIGDLVKAELEVMLDENHQLREYILQGRA